MKKIVRVTVEKEIEVELPDHMLTPEFKEAFEKSMWEFESEDELFIYAARMAAINGPGAYDFLGQLGEPWSKYPKEPDVKFEELYEDEQIEVVEGK